jgi:peptidoglycan/xylan/chitin deacetylase (PgdA/CDA1 family)
MIDWKGALITAGFAAIEATRADRSLYAAARGCGVILMFHRVRPWQQHSFAPNRSLEITPEFLDGVITLLKRQGFELIALDDVPGRLDSQAACRPFAAVTFDDGYRDTLEYAWPILKRHEVPWTVYIVSGFADRRYWPWWIELEGIIARLDSFEVMLRQTKLRFDTCRPRDKHVAYRYLLKRLKAEPPDELRAVVTRLASLVDLDFHQYAAEQCATWNEISELARDPYVTIGSHAVSHASLAHCSSIAAAQEIKDSKAIIEERLGRQVRHLAFPFGGSDSAGPREFSLSRKAGYLTAVTTRAGHVQDGHARDLLALPRVSINGNYQSPAAIRALLSGVPFMAWPKFPRAVREGVHQPESTGLVFDSAHFKVE